MDFRKTEDMKGATFSGNFLDNVNCLIYSKNVIHHSHITGDIIGYAHSFCNLKVGENKNQISVIAHNLFGFDFFFFLKGLKLGSWRIRNILIGGTNLVNINVANIANQVKFTDTLKNYLQSLSVQATTMTDQEKYSIKKGVKNLLKMTKS